MTCWIEDELHLERHSLREPVPLPLYPAASSADARVFAEMTAGMRSCSAFCQDGTHATVAFISDEVAKPEMHRNRSAMAPTRQPWPRWTPS